MEPAAAGICGGAVGAADIEAYLKNETQKKAAEQEEMPLSQGAEPRQFSTLSVSEASNPYEVDPAEPINDLADRQDRPTLASRVNTISDLHLPGEFPRGKSSTDDV